MARLAGRRNKYNNNRSGGFDSTKEKNRYQELLLLERAGLIADLQRQVEYVLIPDQRANSREVYAKGVNRGKSKPGQLLERKCCYRADFVYTDVNTGQIVVEDVKGYRKGAAYDLFKVKRKLMLWRYGIRVRET